MSFAKLYEEVQAQTGRISTSWLRERAIALSTITRIKEQWTGQLEGDYLRGFYLEGPIGPPVPLNAHEALIGLSRDMMGLPQGKYWRRFILTKELMHVFDEPHEKASTAEAFDAQVERFRTPNAEASILYRAELKALWRALAVLCQADRRHEYRDKLAAGEVSAEVVATALHLPTSQVRNLVSQAFEDRLAELM